VKIFQKKKIAHKLIEKLYEDNNSLSVTLTGSYSDHFDLDRAGDIDIVIICKNLDELYFNRCIKKLKIIKKKYLDKDKSLIINTTFGPIKFYQKDSIVFHLMIYDLKSHINHTIRSPFTCYDWERSKIYLGKSLKELSPVFKLQLRDFSEARRSTQEYLRDISNNKISYREYEFKNKKVKLKKKYFNINQVNRRDFIFHTIKFLLINYIKYEKEINIKIKDNNIDNKFLEIVKNKKDLFQFKKLRSLKKIKSTKKINDPRDLALRFISKFDEHIKNNESKNIYFTRHKKSLLNYKKIFLGQKLNPKIINKKILPEFKKIKFDKCFSSPSIRCKETALLICKKNKILIDNHLKEIDYGKVEGLEIKEFIKKYPDIINKWTDGKDPKFPNGESTLDVLIRLKKFIRKELNYNKIKSKKNIIIFTHNVMLRCLVGNFFRLKKKEWFKINIEYFDLLEFILEKNRLISNVDRKKFLKIFDKFYSN
jgi:ribonuclease H / adenosylcobalamin/alpha-ribazole phosphatase